MTLICHSKKFIFLKTRKTAGTTLEMALQQYCAPRQEIPERTGYVETEDGIIGTRAYDGVAAPVIEHMSARQVREFVGEQIWRDYLKITVVRNPYEKLISEFYWANQEAKKLPRDAQIEAFRAWVLSDQRKWTVEDRNIIAIGQRPVAQVVVRHENFDADIGHLAERLEIPPLALQSFKRGIRPRRIEFIHYYNRQTVNFVRSRFAFELSVLGYGLESLFPYD